jgi:hypothetical protein
VIGETRPQPLRLLDVSRLMEPERWEARRMSSEAGGHSIYNWVTVRYLVDPQREITVPLEVILWSEEHRRLWFGLPRERERLPTPAAATTCPPHSRAYLGIARQAGRLAPVGRAPL